MAAERPGACAAAALALAVGASLALAADVPLLPGGTVCGIVCRPTRVIDRLPAGARVDSVWTPLRPQWLIARIQNMPGRWAITREWYQRFEEPGRYYSFAELDSLATAHVIRDETQLAIVRVRFVVRAKSQEDAGRAAVRREPLSRRQLDREFAQLEGAPAPR